MITNLHIQVALRNNITWLKQSYFTPPFKVANITEDKKAGPLHLMLMSSSPGILDGDAYQLLVELEAGTSLHLQTQSYQRLFNMKQSATQQLDIKLADGACLLYLPHPAVPHAQSNFKAVNNIYLSDNCQLVFGEILTPGRKLNDESFLFSRYHNLTNIFIDDQLVIKENLLIEPSKIDVAAIGQLEGFTHQASFIYLDAAVDVKAMMAIINEFLSTQQDIEAGITAAPVNGILVRLLAQKAELLHDCLKSIAGLLPLTVTNKRNYHAL